MHNKLIIPRAADEGGVVLDSSGDGTGIGGIIAYNLTNHELVGSITGIHLETGHGAINPNAIVALTGQ